MRHERLDLLRHAHALLDGALHANQTDAVLVLDELADRANAAVAEVIDVVDRAAAVLQLDEVTNGLEDVLRGQHRVSSAGLLVGMSVELVVQLEAADLGEVVALGVEEQVVEELLRRLERRRIAGAEATINSMIASSVVLTLSAMSVSRRYEPTLRPSMNRTLNCSMPASRSSSTCPSVSSSLHSRMTSPVSLSTMSCAATLPTSSSTSIGSRSIFGLASAS